MSKKNKNYDAIIVPGGGLTDSIKLPLWSKKRFNRAIEVHNDAPIIALSAGTTHKPFPLDKQSLLRYESAVGADYLKEKGVNENQILIETASLDTIGNAFFVKLIHVDPQNLRNLLIITSDFHMPRTQAIFEWVFGLIEFEGKYHLNFESTANDGMDLDVLKARKAKEAESLEKLQTTIKRVQSFKELHQWMFREHAAYSPFLNSQPLTGCGILSY